MIDDVLTPLLKRNEAPSLETMKSDSKRSLTKILDYNENEKKFLDKFLDHAEYQPELLFESNQAQLLKNHPAILWKLQNLRKFKGLD